MAACSKIICVGCGADLSALNPRDRRNLGPDSTVDTELREQAISGWTSLVSKQLGMCIEETSIDVTNPGKM